MSESGLEAASEAAGEPLRKTSKAQGKPQRKPSKAQGSAKKPEAPTARIQWHLDEVVAKAFTVHCGWSGRNPSREANRILRRYLITSGAGRELYGDKLKSDEDKDRQSPAVSPDSDGENPA